MERSNSRSKQQLKNAAMQEVLPGYEEYLVLLQERNRLLKRMRKKNKKQIDIERKEHGFSVYVNGANKGAKGSKPSQQQSSHEHTETPRLKTAGDVSRKKVLDHRDLEIIAAEEHAKYMEQKRGRTAPARERRRNWIAESVDIKTDRGDKRRLRAPEKVTGNYDDDFEDSDDSDDFDSEDSLSENEQIKEKIISREVKKSPIKSDKNKRSYKKSVSDDSEEEVTEKLMLSIADVKKLRHSLAMNASIKESLAREISSDNSLDQEIKEEIESIDDYKEEEFSDRDSPIPEEDEIEEDLVPAMDSISLEDKKKKPPMFKNTDTIVLELAAPPTAKNKVQKNLSAARKKDVEEVESRPSSSRPSSARPSSSGSIASQQKKNRPLSANRVNQPDRIDSQEEASAVLAALREENEKASKINQLTPRKIPQTSDKQKLRGSVEKSESAIRRSQVKSPSRESIDGKRVKTPLRVSQDRKRVKTPSRESLDGKQMKIPVRDSVTDSVSSDDTVQPDKLITVMKKVLMMKPKQQKRLMKVLGKLEDSVVEENDLPGKCEQPKPEPRKPVKATRPIDEMAQKSVKREPRALPPPPKPQKDDMLDVNIELLSNWGNKEKIGLTEIQFFDQNRKLIPVNCSHVAVSGAKEQQGSLSVLFNGKTKTNKDRNMWCCRNRKGARIEICIGLPGKDLSISRIKIWNYNKSINDLDIGVKDVRVFVGGELIYTGDIDKGCGNQVFDYGHIINLKESAECSPRDPQTPSPKPSSPLKISQSPRSESKTVSKSSHHHSISPSASPLHEKNNPFQHSPSPINEKRQPFHRSPSPSPRHEKRQPFNRSPSPSRQLPSLHRSRSRSSEDSYNNGLPPKNVKGDKPTVRSETRTMNHADKNLRRPSIGSDGSSPENEDGQKDDCKMPTRHRGSKTPRKSKRMAAKLDGHNSSENSSSRSASESIEQKPPKIPSRKSEEKILAKSEDRQDRSLPPKPADRKKLVEESLKANRSVQDSVSQSQDDVPMIQKLKEMNNNFRNQRRPNWLEYMMNQDDDVDIDFNYLDQKRKKDVPTWLKPEDMVEGPFESPATSQDGSRQEQPMSNNNNLVALPTKDHMIQSRQDDIDMLIDEELAMWPQAAGKTHLQTVFDDGSKSTQEKKEVKDHNEQDRVTPLQKIQQKRGKWRENQKRDLEESWGSLNMFDRHQKGRLSMDLDDDALDEYLNPPKKLQLPQEVIPEEPEDNHQQQNNITDLEEEDDGFVIPELPYGKDLVINIKTTWGDKHYVGLTGIEVFSATGEPVNITKISADPKDINVLSDYDKDPRVVTNLIDGVTRTRDDVHMWLAPFTAGGNHYIYMTFEKPCKIALMRIWNYNKSRIHSYRGAKDVIITLDGTQVFKGEIERACGGIEGGTEAFGDTILFSTDEEILDAVSRHDEAYEGDLFSDDEPIDVPFERPSTADEGEDRPFTRAQGNLKKGGKEEKITTPRPATSMVTCEGDVIVFKGKCLELNFTATWGDLHYLGLTGLEVVGKDGEALPITLNMITANPRDVRSLPGHERDDRTLDKVIDGTNITMSDEHMWLVPFIEGYNHTVKIEFKDRMLIAGLRVWNYNKSMEDTFRGARTVHVALDGRQISPPEGYLIRKGPGSCHFDFAQEISFAPPDKQSGAGSQSRLNQGVRNSLSGDLASQEYETMQMPCGFIFQFQLVSTWGDLYYIGLNGLEVYDIDHNKIELTENNISAYPDSVNVLGHIQNDVRTPDKLINGINDQSDGCNTWLAPILPGIINRVYLIFDQPTTISMIKLWNYSKTAQRGVKDFALLVDDLLVYNGTLHAITQGARGILPTCDGPQQYHTILFSDNKDILKKEKHTIVSNQTGEQDVQMTNDKKIMTHYNDPKKAQAGKPVNQDLRPKTGVTSKKRR